jgi:2-methylcitrate dehydratase PrpD
MGGRGRPSYCFEVDPEEKFYGLMVRVAGRFVQIQNQAAGSRHTKDGSLHFVTPETDRSQKAVARRLAENVASIRFDDLPREAVDNAAMLVASTVASAALGTHIESARSFRKMVLDRSGGSNQCSAWFEPDLRFSLVDAVRLNAVRSSAAASDDSDLRNIIHLGTPATTAAIAAAEYRGSTGADLLTAIVCGYESAARIGWAITPGYQEVGFHGCVAAIFASTVASGKLLGLDVDALTNAIALAATSISGLVRSADVSTAREHHDSMAAALGIEAAIAASYGFTSDEYVFERPQGYFEVFGRTPSAEGRQAVLDEFGKRWEIVDSMAIKLMPGGQPFHAGGEAGAGAIRAAKVEADEVSSITLTAPGLIELIGPVHPTNLVEMAHSQAYFVAAGVVDGGVTWQHAAPEKISDPRIHQMIDRISVGPENVEAAAEFRHGATVTVGTRAGNYTTCSVHEPTGSAAQGLGWEDVDSKFEALTPLAGLSASETTQALQLIHRLAELPNAGQLAKALSQGPGDGSRTQAEDDSSNVPTSELVERNP